MKKKRLYKINGVKPVFIIVALMILTLTLLACSVDTSENDEGSDGRNPVNNDANSNASDNVGGSECNDSSNSEGNDSNNSASTPTNSGALTITSNSPLTYALPSPNTVGSISVEEALESRRSRRDFQDKALSAEQLSQILWASYGITSERGLRTSPSAGATYPLEIYAVIGNVEEIEPGVYRYLSDEHKIEMVVKGDVRAELSGAALNQRMVRDAPALIFYSAVFERITGRYGERGINYVYIEVGHSAQNVYLQVESLGLGTCAIGAFTDSSVRELLNLPENEEPIYLMPVGYYH